MVSEKRIKQRQEAEKNDPVIIERNGQEYRIEKIKKDVILILVTDEKITGKKGDIFNKNEAKYKIGEFKNRKVLILID